MPPGVRAEDADAFLPSLGGSAANIAVALTRHGMKATLLSAVSDDAVGRFCLAQLKIFGVDAEHVRLAGSGFRTSLSLVESRLHDKHAIIYRNGAADLQITSDDLNGIEFSSYDLVVVTGTAFASEPSREACFRALVMAQTSGTPALIDLDYRPYSWTSVEVAAATYASAAAQCAIVVGNEEEFAVMAGGAADGLAVARTLAAKSATVVIYKMGPRGAFVFHGGNRDRTGVFPVTAIKPSGAGDAFLGALVASLSNGRTVRESVIRGSAAAAMVVVEPTCAPAMPTTAQLDEFLERQRRRLTEPAAEPAGR